MVFRHARALADLQLEFGRFSVPGLASLCGSRNRSIDFARHLSNSLRARALSFTASSPKLRL